MKSRKNRPLILTMSIVFALIVILAVTFAWFAAHDSVTNHLETGSLTNGDAKIIEIFDEDVPMNPGTSVNKLVGVVNTGSTEAFVRISFAEVIQKLADDGVPAAAAAKFDGETANIIPQLFDEAAIAQGGVYSTWTELESPDANFNTASLDAFLDATKDIVVRYNIATVNSKTYYQFVAYAPLSGLTGVNEKYNGKLQVVDIDINADKSADAKLSIKGTIKFMQYTQDEPIKAKWAVLTTDYVPFYGYPITLNTPTITLPEAASHVDSDVTIPMVKLVFGAAVKTNLAVCDQGEWWYNSNDGYFYYIGKLSSGAKTTTWLLEAVKLDETAGDAYCNLNYDLTPCMDAIQAEERAVSEAGGWNLGGDPSYSTLIRKLMDT